MSAGAEGKVLVTGASGFVGGHVVDALLDRGLRVRCLVRATSRVEQLPLDRIELVTGDAVDPGSLPPALEGVSHVIHAAGITRAPRLERYRQVNAEGTRHLARAARAGSDVRRFLLVSSLAAGGPSRPGRPRREEDDPAPEAPYGRSKLEGESALREEAGEMAWTIVRPPAVYGPRDVDFLKLYRMVARGLALRVGGPRQEISLVHGRDLAEGMVTALLHPAAAGRTYYMAHPEVLDWDTLGRLVAEHLGRIYRALTLPRGLVSPVSRLAGWGAALTGRENPFPPDRVKDLLAPAWTCDPSRAERELGVRAPHDARAGIGETLEWCRREGLLR